MKLRQYQQVIYRDCIDSNSDVLYEMPTGSGKTLVMLAIASKLAEGGRRVVIATTQRHIEEGFTSPSGATVQLSEGQSVTFSALAAREDGSSRKKIIEHLSGPDRVPLVCTHNALCGLRDVPSEAGMLIVDEAHHSAALRMAQVVHRWKQAGWRIVYFTACLFRGDGDPVPLPGMRIVRRTLADHMEAGFAPKSLRSEIVSVPVTADVDTGQFIGTRAGRQDARDALCREMVQVWQEMGSPKVVVRVPPARGGSTRMVSEAAAAFGNTGARVLDLSGVGEKLGRRCAVELDLERKRKLFEDSKYDVVIGVQRVAEGMDWPWCSHVFCVGLPQSIATVVQLWGRATRLKPSSYPQPHRDVAGIHFFIPVASGAGMAELLDRHLRRSLVICSYLANAEANVQWVAMQQLAAAGVMNALSDRNTKGPREPEAYPQIDPALRAAAEAAIAEAETRMKDAGTVPTVGDLLRQASIGADVPRSVIRQVLVENIVASGDATLAGARHILADSVAASIANGVGPAIENAFDAVLAEFAGQAVSDLPAVHRLRRHAISLSGSEIRQFGLRVSVPTVVEGQGKLTGIPVVSAASVSLKEAARRLGLDEFGVVAEIAGGKIKSSSFTRIPLKELEARCQKNNGTGSMAPSGQRKAAKAS